MLNKDELRTLRTAFWEEFEQATKKTRTANNRKLNWAQYKSGIKDIYFRLDFNFEEAFLAIDLQMRDPEIRELIWDQFMETETLLKTFIGNELKLYPNFSLSEGFEIHRMKWSLEGVNLHDEKDYAQAIQYLTEKIRGMDRFWFEYSDLFNALCR